MSKLPDMTKCNKEIDTFAASAQKANNSMVNTQTLDKLNNMQNRIDLLLTIEVFITKCSLRKKKQQLAISQA